MNRVNIFAIHRCINEGYGLIRIFSEKNTDFSHKIVACLIMSCLEIPGNSDQEANRNYGTIFNFTSVCGCFNAIRLSVLTLMLNALTRNHNVRHITNPKNSGLMFYWNGHNLIVHQLLGVYLWRYPGGCPVHVGSNNYVPLFGVDPIECRLTRYYVIRDVIAI